MLCGPEGPSPQPHSPEKPGTEQGMVGFPPQRWRRLSLWQEGVFVLTVGWELMARPCQAFLSGPGGF